MESYGSGVFLSVTTCTDKLNTPRKVRWHREIDIHTVKTSHPQTDFELSIGSKSLPEITPTSCLGTDGGDKSVQAKPMQGSLHNLTAQIVEL